MSAIALSPNKWRKKKKKEKQKPENKPQTEQIIKEFSQMKKFTFIRFIEPAEREEIGIGHYGEGEAEAKTGG